MPASAEHNLDEQHVNGCPREHREEHPAQPDVEARRHTDADHFTSLPSAMSFCIAPAKPTRITNTPSASLYYRSQYATRQSCRDTIYTRPIFPCRCQVRRSALYYRHRCKRISRLKLPIANARGFLSTIAFLALERCKC